MLFFVATMLSAMGFIWGAYICARPFSWRTLPELYVAIAALITLSGYILSGFDLFANPWAWCVAGVVCAGAMSLASRANGWCGDSMAAPFPRSGPLTAECFALVGVFGTLVVMQFAVVLASAPHNADSMTYHMARVGYYLQHGNIDTFPSNFWAQLMHPKNSAIAMSYLSLITGYWTNAAQFLQFSAWLVMVVANYGSSIRLGAQPRFALLAALSSGLIVEVVLQATTTQDDLYIAALGASFLYFALGYLHGRSPRDACLTAAAFGLAIGTKLSGFLLMIPLCAVVALLAWLARAAIGGEVYRRVAIVALFCVGGFAAWGLPAGYWENYKVYGNPLGDSAVIDAKTGDSGAGDGARIVAINVARYGLDFIDPSGMPDGRAFRAPIEVLRAAYISTMARIGLPLRSAPTLDPPYEPSSNANVTAHEDFAYWGPWFLLVFLPLLAAGLIRAEHRAKVAVLAAGAMLFVLLQAVGVYDPWRGRYFIQMVVFLVPAAALGWPAARFPVVRIYLAVALAVCCATSVNAVLERRSSNWSSTLHMDWVHQVARNTPELINAFETIEATVPQDATILVSLEMAYSEFPLFGRRLSRKLYPAPDMATLSTLSAQHPDAYIVFNKLLSPSPNDCKLSGGIYLRRVDDRSIAGCPTQE